MRVIAGKARRQLLIAPKGMATRPTSDKTKETLFNVLMPYIYSDTKFLDLFSGSGAIGIEALSRGAQYAVFVEKSKPACECIKTNLKTTRFEDSARLMSVDVITAINQLEGRECFDIIFMDPPYNNEYERIILERLSSSSLINDDTLIVVEASNDTDFDYLPQLGFEIIKHKQYKNNCHVFIMKENE